MAERLTVGTRVETEKARNKNSGQPVTDKILGAVRRLGSEIGTKAGKRENRTKPLALLC